MTKFGVYKRSQIDIRRSQYFQKYRKNMSENQIMFCSKPLLKRLKFQKKLTLWTCILWDISWIVLVENRAKIEKIKSQIFYFSPYFEASLHDRINMTEFRLELDWKIFTTNLNNWTFPKNMTTTNINLTPKKYPGAFGLDRSPSPGLQGRTGRDTCPALLCYSTRKNIRHGG